MNIDPDRLKKLAEQEDGCPVWVGGLMHEPETQMEHPMYATSSKQLDDLLSHFFEVKVFAALRPRFSQPEVMRMAAFEAFMHPSSYDELMRESLRRELTFQNRNGILFFASKHNKNN